MVQWQQGQGVHHARGLEEGWHRARFAGHEPRLRDRLAFRLAFLREGWRAGQLQSLRKESHFLPSHHRLVVEVR